MYKQQVSIVINTSYNRNELLEEFEYMLSGFAKSGQIYGKYEVPYIIDNTIMSFQNTPERNSLSKKYCSEYTKQNVDKLQQLCDAKVTIKVVASGKSLLADSVCKCKNPESYVLFTHAFNDGSPVECGTCGKTVPLYKLAGVNYSDCMNINRWESDYKACDNLYLGCSVGEKWAKKQMSDYKSQLTKQGIDTCNMITARTGITTYYYLFNYQNITEAQDKAKKCPSCGADWLQTESRLSLYNFCCDHCNLLSSLTMNGK